jgi:MFS family permease
MAQHDDIDRPQPPADNDYLTEEPEGSAIEPDLFEDRPLWKRVLLWFVPNLTAFIASFCIMVIELVAGRIIARHLGSSLYTWTSVIGVVLAGITIGNLVGGRLADRFRPASVLAVLFLLAGGTCLAILPLNKIVNDWRQSWSVPKEKANIFLKPLFVLSGEPEDVAENEKQIEKVEESLAASDLSADEKTDLAARKVELLKERTRLDGEKRLPWSAHIFFHVLLVFFVPSTLLGTIGPVVAKMALDQGRRVGKTVGNVYAWGALGSIVGTFLTGFYLISWLSTGPTVIAVAVVLILIGILYSLGRFWPYAIPAASIVFFIFSLGVLPYEKVERFGQMVYREKLESDEVYVDESDYCYIKIDKQTRGGKETRRDLVIDSLIHAELVPDEPGDLQYEYEKIYQALTHKFARVTPPGGAKLAPPDGPAGTEEEEEPMPEEDIEGGNGGAENPPAQNLPVAGANLPGEPEKDPAVAAAPEEPISCLFLGGGGYVYPRYIRSVWPDSYIEVAEIDPAVTAADVAEFQLDEKSIQIVNSPSDRERKDNPMWIYHLDARLHVSDLVKKKEAGEKVPQFDFVYGDAFNFLGVPFHLTTREFNIMIRKLLNPDCGIYMINVIDIFKSGKFVGAIYNTFRDSDVFGENVYVLCTNEREPDMRDNGRDTFIVVGSMKPLDLTGLPGKAAPYEYTGCTLTADHLASLEEKTMWHGSPMVLEDNFAPVENLLEYVVNRWRFRD